MTMKKILVPIDASADSRRAVPWARTMARLSGASLHLVHSAEEEAVQPLETPGALRERLQLAREEMEGAILEQLTGPSSVALPAKAEETPQSVIVVPMFSSEGARPKSGLSPFAEQVLRGARCPILLVPPSADPGAWRPGKIIVPQDSTAETAYAIEPAVAMARQNGGTLFVVHVPNYSTERFLPEHEALPFPRYMDQPQHEFPAWKQEFIERLRELGQIPASVDVQLVLALGDPANEILDWSTKAHADLIAIPWRGDFNTARVLRKVLKDATCPVLTLPFHPVVGSRRAA
ncbi:MAG: universal stress protein [Oligoflexia bacterium]|nr:universal stress protein [Oligoflexia bacterium]